MINENGSRNSTLHYDTSKDTSPIVDKPPVWDTNQRQVNQRRSYRAEVNIMKSFKDKYSHPIAQRKKKTSQKSLRGRPLTQKRKNSKRLKSNDSIHSTKSSSYSKKKEREINDSVKRVKDLTAK